VGLIQVSVRQKRSELWVSMRSGSLMGSTRENLGFFRGLIALKPYVPHQVQNAHRWDAD